MRALEVISSKNYIVRPRRVAFIGLAAFYEMRKKGEIIIKGKCPKCGFVFDLPRRTKAPLYVECPKCHTKHLRISYIITYLRG